jgi:predicted ribosomally synthesized peptide with nif11-like leader
MPKQEISRLSETLARDAALRARLEQAQDVDAMIAAAREAGYDLTAEELREAVQAQRVLTEDQLERVAGGASIQVGNVLLLPAVQKVYKFWQGL